MTDRLKEFAKEIADGEERRETPDRRVAGWHEELKEELNEHAERIEGRLSRFFSRALGAFAVMGIAVAVSLAGFAVVLDSQKSTTSLIQRQRYDAFLQNCLDTNVRHDKALSQLDKAARNAHRSKASEKASKSIIEAAVPYTSDCREFARGRVKGEE